MPWKRAMTKTRCAAPLAELSQKSHRSLLCYVPQAWLSADDMDGAADFQLPKQDGARTNVETTESKPIELGAAEDKQGFVPEQEDFLSASGAMLELIEAVAHERAVAMFTAGDDELVNFVLTKVVDDPAIADAELVKKVIHDLFQAKVYRG